MQRCGICAGMYFKRVEMWVCGFDSAVQWLAVVNVFSRSRRFIHGPISRSLDFCWDVWNALTSSRPASPTPSYAQRTFPNLHVVVVLQFKILTLPVCFLCEQDNNCWVKEIVKGKVKLPLCSTDQALLHEDMRGSGCIDNHLFLTSALVGGEWSASRLCRVDPGERAIG
jgi:hypothetical protein